MLLYIEKVKTNQKQFAAKVELISAKLGINPNWLMLVMHSESRLNHQAVNKVGGATGLIQFMPATAQWLGTTTNDLKNMSNVDQLDYVFKYFKPFSGKLKSYYDLYMACFFPAAIGKPDDFIIQTKNLKAEVIAQQNPAININKDDIITVSEFKKYVNSTLTKNVLNFLNNKVSETIGKQNQSIMPLLIAFGLIAFFIFK